jgi:Tol biopolymer transport system component
MRRPRSKLTYVIPTLCLFMLVGGGTATARTRIVWSRYSQTFSRLRLVSARPNGRQLRKLTHPSKHTEDIDASISPNGRQVAFERDRLDRETSEIALVRAHGQNEHSLDLGCVDPCMADLTPTWLPAGDRIAFTQVLGPEDPVTHNAASAVFHTARPNGSHVRRLSQPGIEGKFEDYRARFSPDGSYVVFERLRLDTDASALFRMDADGSHVRRLTPWKLEADTQDLSLATHGPTKDLVAFETYGHGGPPRGKSQNIATVPSTCAPVSACRKKVRYLTHHRGGKGQSFNPSWSPDGRRIAYVRFREGDRNTPPVGDIWTARANGTHRRAVSTSPLFEFRPDWGAAPAG